jgi:hypothetical protein
VPEDISRNVFLTTSMDSYRGFLNDGWCARLLQLTATKVKLSEIVLDLTMDWKAAANTASMPLWIIDHMKAFHDSFVNTGELDSTLLRLAQVIPGRLALDLPELKLDPSTIPRLQAKLVELGTKFEEDRDKSKCEFPVEETWQSYLEELPYQLCLWGSQRICYTSIYNAYENFVVRVVCIAQSTSSCRSSDGDFNKRLAQSFGEPLRDKCWTGSDFVIARRARHALSHAGGRLTEKLARMKHGFDIHDERIQVTPEKTKALFALLKDGAYALAEKAVRIPGFDSI